MARLGRGLLRLALAWPLLILAAAMADEEQPPRDVVCRMGSTEGARRYRPGVWGLVQVNATNSSSERVEAEAVFWFVDEPTLQFARRVNVPPNSVLRTTCPIRIPDFISRTAGSIEYSAIQVDVPGQPPSLRSTPLAAMQASQLMPVDHVTPAMAMIADLDQEPSEFDRPYHAGPVYYRTLPDDPAYEMVLAAKRVRGLSRSVSILEIEELPVDAASLDAVDVLALCSDRILSDPGSIANIRDWVMGGGRLWIMLDDVRSDTVVALLGDAYATTEVDRVRLTQFSIRHADDPISPDGGEHVELEEPVDFVRVIPSGVTVSATLDGWPAAFWQPCGAGRVYFTTAGPSAWIRPSTPRDPRPLDPQQDTWFYPREPLIAFAQSCLVPRSVSELDATTVQPFLAEQIGYRIIGRNTVAALLGAFCLVIAVGGIWGYRAGRPERLLWMAPLAVGVASIVFVALAISSKRMVPPTVASMTRVLLEPGLGTAHVTGMAAMYNQDACDDYLGADRGGLFFPDMQALGGLRRRLVWTDEGAWHWETLQLPAGVRTAPVKQSLLMPRAVDCRAQFGPEGLRGSVEALPWHEFEDALITVPHQPALAAQIQPDGVLTARASDILPLGEYVANAWLRDQQRQRKTILTQLVGRKPEIGAPVRPVLLAWAGATDLGFRFPQPHARHTTLISLPVRLEPTPPGTPVVVPATFIPYRSVADAQGNQPASFGNLMREWGESQIAGTETLRFQLPATVLPMRVSRATLSITVRAPSRSLQILAFRRGEPVVVERLRHPIGNYVTVLDTPELLELDPDGGLLLAITVSEDGAAHPMGQASWKIDSLHLEVAGTVGGEGHE